MQILTLMLVTSSSVGLLALIFIRMCRGRTDQATCIDKVWLSTGYDSYEYDDEDSEDDDSLYDDDEYEQMPRKTRPRDQRCSRTSNLAAADDFAATRIVVLDRGQLAHESDEPHLVASSHCEDSTDADASNETEGDATDGAAHSCAEQERALPETLEVVEL